MMDKKIATKINQPKGKWELNQLEFKELFLEDIRKTNPLNYSAAFKMNGYDIVPEDDFKDEVGYLQMKDSLGFMNFIIMDFDDLGNPVLIENKGFENKQFNKSDQLTVFRFSLCTKGKE